MRSFQKGIFHQVIGLLQYFFILLLVRNYITVQYNDLHNNL